MGARGRRTTKRHDAAEADYDRLMAVLNAIESAVALVDKDDRITALNERAARFLGDEAALSNTPSFTVLMKRNFAPQLKDPKPFLDWLEIVQTVFEFSSPTGFENRRCELTYAGDEERNMTIYASPVSDSKGRRTGIFYAIADITEMRRAQSILEAVSDAAREINSDLQVKEMLPSLFEVVKQRVPLDGMAILSIKDNGRMAVLGCMPESFLGGAGASAPLLPGQPGGEILIDLVSDIGKYLDAEADERSSSLLPEPFLAASHKEGMESMAALPLTLPGQVIGIWVLASKQPRSYFHEDMAFLEPVSGHLAAAVKNATLLETTREMYSAAVRALAATVDIRDSYTMHHSEHVSMVAKRIGEEMRLSKDELEVIELAGLVHDIGKVGIPDSILQKAGPLGPAERSVMTNHSMLGASILERAGMLADLAPLVLHHHEWHNGSGYPDKLDGAEIPIGAAILAVADAFDTMITDRLYRPGMSLDEAREELERCSGAQFHPEVVKALCAALDKTVKADEAWLAQITGDNAAEARRVFGYDEPRTLAEQSGDFEQAITSKELEVLFRIAQEMKKLLDLNELLEHICHIVSEEMRYADCVILIPDEAGEFLEPRAGIGMAVNALGIKVPRGQGISWWVMTNGIPQNVPDTSKDERYFAGRPGVESELHIPLEVRGRRLGVLVVQQAEKNGFRPNDMRMLMAVAGHIASAVEVAQLHEQVKKSADTDALTGLHNRRVFFANLEAGIKRAFYGGPDNLVSVVIFDVDNLKAVNDQHGHLVGDDVLTRIASRLQAGFRSCDVVARYGGDEFVALLPGASEEAATRRANAVIASWAKDCVEGPEGQVPLPGASFGVASYPADGEEARVVLSVADDHLRKVKQAKSVR